MMQCYLCGGNRFALRSGSVRDSTDIRIYECNCCGLVQLEDRSHIGQDFYENSRMHGAQLKEIYQWLAETEWDDRRRFEQLKTVLPNKKVLDFGSGAGGFLLKSRDLAETVVGIELEKSDLGWLTAATAGSF